MNAIPASRQSDLLEAANILLDARRTRTPILDLPEPLRPTTPDEACFIQDALAAAYETIGGYKIGAPTPEAIPAFAPMPLAWIAPSGAELSGPRWRYRCLEAEIAFRLGDDLPPRATPYTQSEAYAAVATCHPVLEILESAFEDPTKADKLSAQADLSMHGGLVYGPPCLNWEELDFAQEIVVLAVDGSVRVERTGSNTAGDLLRLLPWLANHGAQRTGGLRAGQWITTGSWTGNTPAMAGSSVDAHFRHVGRVALHFAPDPS